MKRLGLACRGMATVEEAVEELIASPPELHFNDEGPQHWAVGSNVLRWLASNVRSDWGTLETGCGHSSIVFMLTGAEHTIVAPHPWEHERAREWVEARGFPTDRARSVVEVSQRVLPTLPDASLDLGFIDGGHGFPTPFIDWYYIAERLRPGGWMLVDDMHIPTCRLLHDFMKAERGRWEHVGIIDNTSLFRRGEEILIPREDWPAQPWVMAQFNHPLQRLKRVARVRARLRKAGARIGLY
jgi:predicted O-methyltransferase YrrM